MERLVRGFVYLVVAVGVVFITVSNASAQSSNRISGKITDQQGGVLPGATVVAHQVETGIDTDTVTNAAGLYVFPSLPAGSYSVEVLLSPGSPTIVEKDCSFSPGRA